MPSLGGEKKNFGGPAQTQGMATQPEQIFLMKKHALIFVEGWEELHLLWSGFK